MNIPMQIALVAVAACLCLAEGAPDGRLVRTKQQRPTRGFKNVEMMTARGFGKRDRPTRAEHEEYEAPRRRFNPKSNLMVAPDFGKRSGSNDVEEVYGLDNFWEMLEGSPERESQDANEAKPLESISLDWFVSEMLNNPDFTRSVVRKFIDLNQDGILSSDELLRNV